MQLVFKQLLFKKNDYKCLSDEEKKEFKYCKIVSDKCEKCDYGYTFAEDGRCTKTDNCFETENGDCIECSEGYYLGLDGKCSNKKHCIYSSINSDCVECEDGYVWDNFNQKCNSTKDKFENCRITLDGEICSDCKKKYYLNITDRLCYDNTKKMIIINVVESLKMYVKNAKLDIFMDIMIINVVK